jgi:hypothetical protein
MDFVDVDPRELVRLIYGELLRESYVIDGSVVDKVKPVTLKVSRLTYWSAESMLIELLKGQGIEVRRIGGVIVVRQRDESREDKETLV